MSDRTPAPCSVCGELTKSITGICRRTSACDRARDRWRRRHPEVRPDPPAPRIPTVFNSGSSYQEIPLHGKTGAGRSALIDSADYELVSPYTWFARRKGKSGTLMYAWAWIGPRATRQNVLMHKLITGWPLTDHTNRNGLDNRRSNLRLATHQQNLHNSAARNKTGFKGVQQTSPTRWAASIFHGNPQYLGAFESAEGAARAYDTAARQLFGEFAFLNFPDEDVPVAKEIRHYRRRQPIPEHD